jgi:hypothetical protein
MRIRDEKNRIQDGKNSDRGSGINIPDPQHLEIRYLGAVDWTGRQARLRAPGFWTRSAGSGRRPPPSRIISQGSLVEKRKLLHATI